MRKPDEIMAEYLLKGGKMLSKTCSACNSPLFEVKGRTFCVVCEEETKELQAGNQEESLQKESFGGASSRQEQIRTVQDTLNLYEEFEEVIRILLQKAENETDTNRLNALMQAVKTAAESVAIISQVYGRRDNS